MFKNLSLMILLLSTSTALQAQTDRPEYAASKIPETLREGANAVVRSSEYSVTIDDIRGHTYTRRDVVTVLSEMAKEKIFLLVGYNARMAKVKTFKAALYDAEGKLIRRAKPEEIIDRSAISDLYDESRIRVTRLMYDKLPYTLEFEVEEEEKQTFHLPQWHPALGSVGREEELAIEKATFTVLVNEAVPFRYKCVNGMAEPRKAKENHTLRYFWHTDSLHAAKPEKGAPSSVEKAAGVLLMSEDFVYDGVKGRTATWKELGKWVADLAKGRDSVPKPVLEKALAGLKGKNTTREKVEAIYKFVQGSTRYISVQLGIGGFQPFPATYVAEKGYGDCKALTNYTYSLLKAANIKAVPALVRAGADAPAIVNDFSATQFNHIILSVPLEKDTMWLECTSQSFPAGHLSDFTGDRDVLLLTEDGGKIAHTPVPKAEENVRSQNITIQLDPSGAAIADVKATYLGYDADETDHLVTKSAMDREKWLREQIKLGAFELISPDFSAFETKQYPRKLNYKLAITQYANKAGTRLLLQPNILSRWSYVPDNLTKPRKTEFRMAYPGTEVDSATFVLPPNFRLETLPPETVIEKPYGSYKSTIRFDEASSKLFYTRKFILRKHRIPAAEYETFQKFLKEIKRADNQQLVMTGNT